jgi:hypothetical protein
VIWAQARQTFPEYEVRAVRAQGGIVTVQLAEPGGRVRFAVALRAAGGLYFTSLMGAQLDAAESTERARVGELVARWYEIAALQQALARCGEDAALAPAEAEKAVREAAASALGGMRLGNVRESRLLVGVLLLSLVVVMVPGLRERAPRARAQVVMEWRDLGLVLCIAVLAVAIAAAVAWRMAPETDEVFTLGARHERFAELLSWRVGGEPFNPPGIGAIFGVWLRLGDGFFWARVLSIALIPATAWLAYRAGAVLFGRGVGLTFAALVILAPAYLRLAAIARGYALVIFSLCAMLAAVAGTHGAADGAAKPAARSRGAALGAACLLSLWVSYLLWPLAFAAPWIARLDRRDRLRVMAVLVVMAAALVPRIAVGFAEGVTRSERFELPGPADAIAYALARAGQVAPADYSRDPRIAWLGGGIIAVLIAMAIVRLRRTDPRWLRNAALILILLVMPILALLSRGHGIRERHVITVQVGLALLAAVGLAGMLAASNRTTVRVLGCLLAIVLAGLSVRGNSALVLWTGDWLSGIDRLRGAADLMMIVPRSAQFPVYAMLTGDSPLCGESLRWPPVCETDTEWWCRRADGLPTVSVDEVSDDVIAAAAASAQSIWIFDVRGERTYQRIPLRLHACEQVFRDATWTVLGCSGTALR